MRLDSRDFTLEELGGVGFAYEVHQYARDGHDDRREVESPTPMVYIRHVFCVRFRATEGTS